MTETEAEFESRSNFNLKNTSVEIVTTSRRNKPVYIPVEDLEVIRIQGRPIPASRYGLETICGASCETAGQ